MAQVENFYPV